MVKFINNLKIKLRDWSKLRYMERHTKPGVIITQASGPLTGKTARAAVWEARDPENRKVTEDPREAKRLAGGVAIKYQRGVKRYAVVLNQNHR